MTKRMDRLMQNIADVPGMVDQLEQLFDQIEDAADEYEAFHWSDPATSLDLVQAPAVAAGDLLVAIGELVAITYDTTKGGERYHWEHPFGRKRPMLAMTRDKRLVIAGGSYRITNRGIEG